MNIFKRVTKKDKRILSEHSREELAKFYCELNTWKWPEMIPRPEKPVYVPNGRRSNLMTEIENMVGEKFISRYWNKDRMTDEEHEAWWVSRARLDLVEAIK